MTQSVLVLQCEDRNGVVAAVAGFLAEHDCSIVEARQHGENGVFFMRTVFESASPGRLHDPFAAVAARFGMRWAMHEAARRTRTLIAVSRFGHCLYELLHRWRSGSLPIDLVGVVSNHEDMRSFVEWSGVPYHYLPMNPANRAASEEGWLELVRSGNVDLVVLARYMQILSPAMCELLEGRCINIHHSFLPSFKGARPYHQAHARGVKLIGATAHYVTADLDEGPIIEQDVARVTHAQRAEELVELGREIECAVLARAVKWHAEQRVIVNGTKTVVLS